MREYSPSSLQIIAAQSSHMFLPSSDLRVRGLGASTVLSVLQYESHQHLHRALNGTRLLHVRISTINTDEVK